jgi:putative transposase
MIAIPPKYEVSNVIGIINGKSTIHLARMYGEKKRSLVEEHFWAGVTYLQCGEMRL